MAKQAVSRQVETGDQARRGRRVRAVLCGASVPALLVLAACSGSHVSGFGSGDGSTPGTLPGQDGSTVVGGNDGSTTILSGGDGAVGSADGSADCPASAKLVYITGIGSELYSFYPPTFTFTKIGKLSCLGPQLSPTHMTVDRQGTAWVVASNGIAAAGLYNASTADASCSKVSTWTAQPKNFPRLRADVPRHDQRRHHALHAGPDVPRDVRHGHRCGDNHRRPERPLHAGRHDDQRGRDALLPDG